MTFAEAKALFRTARNPDSGKPLGRSTRLIDHGVYFAVAYHWTVVVSIYCNGAYRLNSGGYRTVTTKRRINQYLPFGWYLWQKDFVWYVSKPWTLGTPTYIFRDGFRIGPRGGCEEKRVK